LKRFNREDAKSAKENAKNFLFFAAVFATFVDIL